MDNSRTPEVLNPFYGKWEKLREQRNRAARNYYCRNRTLVLARMKEKRIAKIEELQNLEDKKKPFRLFCNFLFFFL